MTPRTPKGGGARVALISAFALFLGLPAGLTLLDIFALCETHYLFLASLGAYFGYGIVLSGFMLVVSRTALREIARAPAPEGKASSLTIAIPAFNEAAHILPCLESVLGQSRLPRQIIVVNDGSDDATLDQLIAAYDMRPAPMSHQAAQANESVIALYRTRALPALMVLECRHGGKAAALNTALSLSTGDIFITLDADSILAQDALSLLAVRIESDEHVAAAGGIVQPANGIEPAAMRGGTGGLPSGLLPCLQWIEYATGFVWRFGWSHMNTLLLVSGSFSGFRTSLLKACGGFDPNSLTEDYEVAYRLHEYCRREKLPYKICTAPDALAFTLAPDTLPSLFAQRIRWFQGFLQTLISYRRMVLNPAYGRLGTFMMPVKTMDALLPFWGLYLYATLAVNVFAERVTMPVSICLVAALIGGRLAIETITSWALLILRESYIRPRLGWRQNLAAAALAPLNAAFQRALWLAYSLTAYWRIATRRRGPRVLGKRGFQGV